MELLNYIVACGLNHIGLKIDEMEKHIALKIKTHYNKHFPHIQFPVRSVPQLLQDSSHLRSLTPLTSCITCRAPSVHTPNCLGALEITEMLPLNHRQYTCPVASTYIPG